VTATALKAGNAVPARKRARSPEDKDLRRAHLIEAATRLFADEDFDAVTVARVAALAGVAKGTAYLYFATKEALFLELVRHELTLWLQGLTLNLKRLQSAQPVKGVPIAMASSLVERPILCRLLVLLHTVIEPKLDETSAHQFKLFLHGLLSQASGLIVEKIPGMTLTEAATLVVQTHALVIGIAQQADPPPVISRLMAEDPCLRPWKIEFETLLTATLTTLWRGACCDCSCTRVPQGCDP
jgi:AcrR family transcriptional regulator